MPGPLAADRVAGAGPLPTPFSYRLLAQKPIRTKGGTVRISDSTTFPAATTIAAAFVEVEPGGMRELHWHPNANEAQYYISGQARMTVFAADATAGTFDYQPGDVGFVPRNMGHYIENTGTTKLQFLELWRTDKFADVSLRQWLAFTPFDLVQAQPEDRPVGPGEHPDAQDAGGARLTPSGGRPARSGPPLSMILRPLASGTGPLPEAYGRSADPAPGNWPSARSNSELNVIAPMAGARIPEAG